MSMVYVIEDDGATRAMSRVRCADEQRELQDLLANNFNLLPGDQIRPDDPRRWILVKREMPVPDPNNGLDRWSIDFLFADQDAIPTFVECKRFADTRSRREVVGQMLEYAANGHHYWSADDLRRHAEESAHALDSSLEKALATLLPNDAEGSAEGPEEYFERLEENLREGQIRIVFFLEESPFELRSVVDFLNRQMERSEVFLVEARQYSHAGSRIVVPALFGYTEQARLVKRSVNVTRNARRRRWDRPGFFQHAGEHAEPRTVEAMAQLLDFAESSGCEVGWGTGIHSGSYNIKEPSVCPRSLITCWSHGDLGFNFGWLTGSETAHEAQRSLRELVGRHFDVEVPDGAGGLTLEAEQWVSKVDVVQEILERIVGEAREASAG